MNTIMIETIGWIAAVVTMVMMVPQVIALLKKKSVDGLSLSSYSVMAFGTHMWILMGALTSTAQAMLTNAVIGVLIIPFFYFFIKNKVALIATYTIMTVSFVASFAIFFIGPFNISSIVDLFVTIFAGTCTGLAFAPQTLNAIKTKNTGNISLMTTLIIITANVIWVVFWVLTLMDESRLSYGFAIGFSALSATTQLPVAFIMLTKKSQAS